MGPIRFSKLLLSHINWGSINTVLKVDTILEVDFLSVHLLSVPYSELLYRYR